MAAKPFSKEELNFFKFSKLVLHEFPKVLRKFFIIMWNSEVAIKPGFITWDDSTQVRNMLLTSEGGKTDIPTTKSIEEWDCTALFNATIYAKTFGVPSSKGSTLELNDLYLKKVKPPPGSFHSSVQSSTGKQDETYALVIDQLRLLRNKLCHLPKSEIIKTDFDNYVLLVKDALSAVNIGTAFVDAIGEMNEDDFPTEKLKELQECRMNELQATSMLRENLEHKLSSIDEKVDRMMSNISLKEKANVPGPPSSFMTHDVCRQFTPKELARIAKRICSVWKHVARLTDLFQSYDIDNISLNTSLHDPTDRATEMLKNFKSRLGKREVLANAIEESGKPDVAVKVRSGYYIDNSD